jgi:hypothetical protein
MLTLSVEAGGQPTTLRRANNTAAGRRPTPSGRLAEPVILGWTPQGQPENLDQVKPKPLPGRLRRALTRPRTSGRASLPSRGELPTPTT